MYKQLLKKSYPAVIAAVLAGLYLPAQGLHIGNGSNLVLSGSVNLVLNNASLINDGHLNISTFENSTITFTGDATGTVLSGTPAEVTAYRNLTINKTAGDIRVIRSHSIFGSLNMVQGNFVLDGGFFSLSSGGSIVGENERSYITTAGTGNIIVATGLSGTGFRNPGNIGIEIAGGGNIATALITRLPAGSLLPNGTRSIRRSFSIVPFVGTNSGLNATVRFHYLDAELGAHDESRLALWYDTTSVWSALAPDTLDMVNNVVVKTRITKFGIFTLSEPPASAVRTLTAAAAGGATEAAAGALSVHVLPNPNHGRFTILLSGKNQQNDIVGLYDLSGHLLQRKEIAAGVNNIEWDMSHYPMGVYYLRFEKQAVSPIKIVKQ